MRACWRIGEVFDLIILISSIQSTESRQSTGWRRLRRHHAPDAELRTGPEPRGEYAPEDVHGRKQSQSFLN